MEEEIQYNKSSIIDWVIFLVSTVACVALLIYKAEFFWVLLPFVFTYLAKALKVL